MRLNEIVGKLAEQATEHPTIDRVNALFECCRTMQTERLDGQNVNLAVVRPIVTREIGNQGLPFQLREKYYELFRKSLLFSTRNDLDSYLQYMEIDREPEKRFYLPRRAVFRQIVSAVQDLMDGKLDLVTVSLPPGTGKTTFGTFLLSWVMGKWPDKPNLSSGHSDKMTRSIFDGAYSLVTDPDYKYSDVFPGLNIAAINSKDETIDLEKKKRFPTLTSRSIDGSLTGATRCEKLLYIDDLVSGIEEAMSLDRLQTLWQKYTNDLKSRKKKGCKELHVATRWSVHDPIGRLQAQYEDSPRAKFIVIPALNERTGESNFDYPYDVGFSTKDFCDMRDSLDDVSWRCLYMNQPIEREGLMFHPDMLRYFAELPDEIPCRVISFCDVAWGGGDSLSMPVAFEYDDGRVLIANVVFNHGDKSITKPLVKAMLINDKVQWGQFESNNGGDEYADDISDQVKDTGWKMNVTSKKAPSDKSKVARITQYSPDIKKFYFRDSKHRSPEYTAFMMEFTSFTMNGKVKHDDAPDSLAGLAAMLVGPKKRASVEVLRRTF